METLDYFPTALMVVALLVPVAYCALRRKDLLRWSAQVLLVGMVVAGLYPLVIISSSALGTVGTFLAKLFVFVLVPLIAIVLIERWDVRQALRTVGVRKENLGRSVLYGLAATVITVLITVLIITSSGFNPANSAVTFLDAFSEEFFFRGILLLYLMTRLSNPLAFTTSVAAFVLAHPQNFTSLFFISTAAQAILLGLVVYKTKNIIGAWISHGLNRILPMAIRMLVGL